MKDGKLACVGTPVELKIAYNVGYELLVRQKMPCFRPISSSKNRHSVPSSSTASTNYINSEIIIRKNKAELVSFVLKRIPGSIWHDSHPVPCEQRFTLPLAARSSFGVFLKELESSSDILNCEKYGIAVSSFEEVRNFIFAAI